MPFELMRIKATLPIAAVVLGLASGKSALVAVQSAVPPIDWGSIQFAFIGCVIGIVFVIGIQILRSNPEYGRFAITGMLIASLYFVSSGVSALIIGSTFSPASVFILVTGAGALPGVGLSSLFYKIRHASTP